MKEKIKNFINKCQKSELTPAIIFGSSVNGLSYVRSLGRKNIPLLCLDHVSGPASKSRYGDFVLLNIKENENTRGETEADQIFDILKEKGIETVVFGSADEWQVYIAKRSELTPSPFLSLSPDQKSMDCIIDKQAQYELATSLNIDVPHFANAESIYSGKNKWTDFPAIIKPRWAHLGRGVIGGKALFIDSIESLQENLNKVNAKANINDYIVQKVLKGEDSCLYSYLGFFEPSGNEFIGMVKQKIRQFPPFLGDGSYDMTCLDEPLADAARKLLKAIDYQGLVGVEFKRNPKSDEFGLIEINPRTVSTNQLAINAGIDFPWIAYQMIIHLAYPQKMHRPMVPKSYSLNYHHVNEERDFKSFLIRKKQKEITFSEWFKSVRTAESYALWDKRDIKPFWNMIFSKLPIVLKRIFRT